MGYCLTFIGYPALWMRVRVGLIEQCRKILSAAEKKIQMLTATDSGELECID